MWFSQCLYFVCVTIPRMIINSIRLLLFVLFLLPGFIQFAFYYWFIANRTVIQYKSDSCRQTLDVYTNTKPIYHTENSNDNNTNNNNSDTADSSLLLRPVIVFVPGGAWIIGYKMWGTLTARVLSECGIVVVVPDYRNYPWTTVPGMVSDISTVLQWTKDTIHTYGGNPFNIILVGQSAGGHLIFTTLIRQALGLNNDANQQQQQQQQQQQGDTSGTNNNGNSLNDTQHEGTTSNSIALHNDDERTLPWKATDFKGIITLSAPFDLSAMTNSFQKYGLDDHLVERIFGNNMSDYDPFSLLSNTTVNQSTQLTQEGQQQHIQQQQQQLVLPPMHIYHGTGDQTVPITSNEFFNLLQQRLVNTVEYTMYNNWSHTDAIIEMPMIGNHTFHHDVYNLVSLWTNLSSTPIILSNDTTGSTANTTTTPPSSPTLSNVNWPDSTHSSVRSLCPYYLVQLGRFFMPF
jgi:prenylcysteine alpha-carboxyl methylesterase